MSKLLPVLSIGFAAIAVVIGLWQAFDQTPTRLWEISTASMTIPGDFHKLIGALISQGNWNARAAAAARVSVLF